jgi:hypothetical protein
MAVVPIWDDVYISVYNFTGVNPDFPLVGTTSDYPRGTVDYIGPNVDRVSEGQLVIFKQGAYVKDATNTWAVVSQTAILTIFIPDIIP